MKSDGKFEYRYDAWNRLVEAWPADGGVETVYQYDGLGHRVRKTSGGVSTDYYYNDQWQVVEERPSGGAAAPGRVQYVWSGTGNVPICRFRDADGVSTTGTGGMEEVMYYVTDANNNVTALVDATPGRTTAGTVVERYAYDAYGTPVVMDLGWNVRPNGSLYGNQIMYCSYRYDPETGNYHADQRQYQPSLGVWLQRDPLGYAAGDTNLTRYVGGNPISRTDPTGLDPNLALEMYYTLNPTGPSPNQPCVMPWYIPVSEIPQLSPSFTETLSSLPKVPTYISDLWLYDLREKRLNEAQELQLQQFNDQCWDFLKGVPYAAGNAINSFAKETSWLYQAKNLYKDIKAGYEAYGSCNSGIGDSLKAGYLGAAKADPHSAPFIRDYDLLDARLQATGGKSGLPGDVQSQSDVFMHAFLLNAPFFNIAAPTITAFTGKSMRPENYWADVSYFERGQAVGSAMFYWGPVIVGAGSMTARSNAPVT